MRTFKLACILVLTCSLSLYAKGFKIIKPEKVTAPAGFVEDTSKRGLYHKMFKSQTDTTKRRIVVGTNPLHYVDSLGVLREFNFDAAIDTTSNYTNAVQVGRFRVEYTPTGKLRFLRKKAYVEFFPAFDTTQVGIEFNISGKGVKANYTLDQNSPNRLAWGYNYTATHEKAGDKGKGKIKDVSGNIRAEMRELVAWDAKHVPVPLTVTYTADSLIVVADTQGVSWPVTVDPTISDTTLSPLIMGAWSRAATNDKNGYMAIRHLGTANQAIGFDTRAGAGTIGSYTDLCRTMVSFPLSGATGAVSINSAQMIYKVRTANTTAGVVDSFAFVQGTWTGPPATSKWDEFTGFSSDTTTGAFSVVEFAPADFTTGNVTPENTARTDTAVFNTDGKSATLTKMQAGDTLRMMIISVIDQKDQIVKAFDGSIHQSMFYYAYNDNYFVLEVDYSVIPPSIPGVTTLADLDTLKVNGSVITATMVGKVDTTGGTIDSVGVRYMKKGLSLPTNGLVKKKAQGSLTADDTFFVALASADSLTKDTLYVYQVAAHSAGGWSYSATYDTISTYFGPPTLTTTANPTTYGVPYVYASVTMDVSALGTVTGTYAPAAVVGADSLILRGIKYWLAGFADSTEWNWMGSGKGGAVPYSLSTDTLLIDSTYTVTAYAKGSLGSKTWASDSQTIDLTGSLPVGISAPTYSLFTVTVQFTASIDSGASVLPATKRGFFAWTRVADSTGTDTIRVESSASGGFPYGNYSLPLSCPTDTVLLWRAYAVNAVDTTFGALDSVRTYLAGLTSSLVVGGTDTVQTIIYVGSSGGGGVAGRKPGKFEGR